MMMKECFIVGALMGAAAGIMIYKNNSQAKEAIDKAEKMMKEKIQSCQSKIDKATTKKQD